MIGTNYSVPIRLRGETAEKINLLSTLLGTSIDLIANKLISSIADTAIENTKKFLASMEEKDRKMFLEIFNGTLQQLNTQRKIKTK